MGGQRTTDCCVVTVDILGGRQHGDVGAQAEAVLQHRRQEGIIDGKQDAGMGMNDIGDAPNVCQL